MIHLTQRSKFILELIKSDKPIPIYLIAIRSGLTPKACTRIGSNLANTNKVSRSKQQPNEKSGYYKYWLTEKQRKQHSDGINSQLQSNKKQRATIMGKIHLLKTISDRTVYGQNPYMKAIVNDYEQILLTQHAETEDVSN